MRYPVHVIFIALGIFLTLLTFSSSVNAEVWNSKDPSKHSGVWIPENEFTSFFDASGQYTVIGTIKNSEDFPVLPTITINIEDGKKMISSKKLKRAFTKSDPPFHYRVYIVRELMRLW